MLILPNYYSIPSSKFHEKNHQNSALIIIEDFTDLKLLKNQPKFNLKHWFQDFKICSNFEEII